jgi:addiction module RelB/DinJ family antitoxin
MAHATFSIRMEENLKRQFDALCTEFGMNMSTAFTIFAKAVVREREIPFKISAEPNDMTANWTPEYWNSVKEKLAVSEKQYENDEIKDAFVVMEKAKVKYGL